MYWFKLFLGKLGIHRFKRNAPYLSPAQQPEKLSLPRQARRTPRFSRPRVKMRYLFSVLAAIILALGGAGAAVLASGKDSQKQTVTVEGKGTTFTEEVPVLKPGETKTITKNGVIVRYKRTATGTVVSTVGGGTVTVGTTTTDTIKGPTSTVKGPTTTVKGPTSTVTGPTTTITGPTSTITIPPTTDTVVITTTETVPTTITDVTTVTETVTSGP